jgi:hypothetical protein
VQLLQLVRVKDVKVDDEGWKFVCKNAGEKSC